MNFDPLFYLPDVYTYCLTQQLDGISSKTDELIYLSNLLTNSSCFRKFLTF
jgi:hypothetical protein